MAPISTTPIPTRLPIITELLKDIELVSVDGFEAGVFFILFQVTTYKKISRSARALGNCVALVKYQLHHISSYPQYKV